MLDEIQSLVNLSSTTRLVPLLCIVFLERSDFVVGMLLFVLKE